MGTHEKLQVVEPSTAYVEIGGAKRDRTAYLLHGMQALSQLSYGPMKLRMICREQSPF